MNIGKKIKQIRELRNLTQTYVAERLNMSVGGYSKIESGQTDISISKLKQIAEILDTNLNTILNFDAKNIFNQYNNNNSVVAGIIEVQNSNSNIIESLTNIQEQILTLKELINEKKE